MQLVGIVAPEPEPIVESLVSKLSPDGSVGVIRSSNDLTDQTGLVETTIKVGESGWRGSGLGGSVSEMLDRLARRHDAAVVVGFPNVRAPQLVVGDQEVRRELHRVDDRTSIDFDAVLDALEEEPEWESLGSLVASVKRSTDEEYAGAIATFTGRVRAKEHPDDTRTEYLAYEQYDQVATNRLTEIRRSLEARDGVYAVRCHHRTGIVEAGEDIVFVVVLAGHRGEAFEAVQDGINRLKAEVPIFKKEVTVDDAYWVHER